MNAVRDFLGNVITPGAIVVYAGKHAGTATLRKGTVISVSASSTRANDGRRESVDRVGS